MSPRRVEFRHRDEYEVSEVHPRMWQRQFGQIDRKFTYRNQINVYRAVNVAARGIAMGRGVDFRLNPLQDSKYVSALPADVSEKDFVGDRNPNRQSDVEKGIGRVEPPRRGFDDCRPSDLAFGKRRRNGGHRPLDESFAMTAV